MVNELLNNEDPKLNELLNVLKNKLNIQDNSSNDNSSNDNSSNGNNNNLYKKLKGALNDKLSDYSISEPTPDVIFEDYEEPNILNNSITTNNKTSNKMDPEPFTNYNRLGESSIY